VVVDVGIDRADDGDAPLDHAGVHQPANAPQAGGRGDVGAARQFVVGQRAVGLQQGQQTAVGGVEVDRRGLHGRASACSPGATGIRIRGMTATIRQIEMERLSKDYFSRLAHRKILSSKQHFCKPLP